MLKQVNPFKLPEEELVTFYGALFAMSAIDGFMDLEEIYLILELINLERFSDAGRQEIQSFIVNPPPFEDSLTLLSQKSDIVRFGFMINLLEVAWADDVLEQSEREAIHHAQHLLDISDQEVGAIDIYVHHMKQLQLHKFNKEEIEQEIEVAIEQIIGVNIPVEALHFSGLAMKAFSLGYQTNLTSLGLRIDLLTGINANSFLGTSTYFNLSKLFSSDKKKQEQQFQARKRKTKLILENLQETIADIGDYIQNLRENNPSSEDEKTIELLHERLITLQQLYRVKNRGKLKRHLQQNK